MAFVYAGFGMLGWRVKWRRLSGADGVAVGRGTGASSAYLLYRNALVIHWRHGSHPNTVIRVHPPL